MSHRKEQLCKSRKLPKGVWKKFRDGVFEGISSASAEFQDLAVGLFGLGELVDRWQIELLRTLVTGAESTRMENIASVVPVWLSRHEADKAFKSFLQYSRELLCINCAIWTAEDAIRQRDASWKSVADLGILIGELNDARSRIKSAIDRRYNLDEVEKIYK